jgi:hypothetical protein
MKAVAGGAIRSLWELARALGVREGLVLADLKHSPRCAEVVADGVGEVAREHLNDKRWYATVEPWSCAYVEMSRKGASEVR